MMEISTINTEISRDSSASTERPKYSIAEEPTETEEQEFAGNSGLDRPDQTIDSFSSLCLICNNISGPAMMGLPHLFHSAGILPSVAGIIFVYLTSSLTGTLLSDAVASIPGNGKFHRNLDFSKAFKIVVGDRWAKIAEGLFIMACMSQACTALVETAQSLDGFLSSFLIGKTYAVQFLPYPQVISWSPPASLQDGNPYVDSSDTEPFGSAGSLIFSLGFFITAFMFLPFGTGHLQEAMIMQIISFVCFFLLILVFYGEFFAAGFNVKVPWIGEDIWEVPGVVLFNYAFSITVPAWLNEKHPEVSANKVIWCSTTLTTVIYLSFGLCASMAFSHTNEDVLTILASKQVHVVTRVCAALFGVAIIGAGVPIFCIIIKSSLYTSGACNAFWAYFFGALFPYLISWTMYQGKTLLEVLDWSGVFINGLVAFVLPLLLVLKSIDRISRDRKRREKLRQLEALGLVDLSDEAVKTTMLEVAESATLTLFHRTVSNRTVSDLEQGEKNLVDVAIASSLKNARDRDRESLLRQASKTGGGYGYGAVAQTDSLVLGLGLGPPNYGRNSPRAGSTSAAISRQPSGVITPMNKAVAAVSVSTNSALRSLLHWPSRTYHAIFGGSQPDPHCCQHPHRALVNKYHAAGTTIITGADSSGTPRLIAKSASGSYPTTSSMSVEDNKYVQLTQLNVAIRDALESSSRRGSLTAAGIAAATAGAFGPPTTGFTTESGTGSNQSPHNESDPAATAAAGHTTSTKKKSNSKNLTGKSSQPKQMLTQEEGGYQTQAHTQAQTKELKFNPVVQPVSPMSIDTGTVNSTENNAGALHSSNQPSFDDFDDYSEEDAAENLYGVEDEDRDAVVFDALEIADLSKLSISLNGSGATSARASAGAGVSSSSSGGAGSVGASSLLTSKRPSRHTQLHELGLEPIPSATRPSPSPFPAASTAPASTASASRAAAASPAFNASAAAAAPAPLVLPTGAARPKTDHIASPALSLSMDGNRTPAGSYIVPDCILNEIQGERKSALQRFAVFAHKKIPFNYNVLKPLPMFLEPFRLHIVTSMISVFSSIIVATMIEKTLEMFSP